MSITSIHNGLHNTQPQSIHNLYLVHDYSQSTINIQVGGLTLTPTLRMCIIVPTKLD